MSKKKVVGILLFFFMATFMSTFVEEKHIESDTSKPAEETIEVVEKEETDNKPSEETTGELETNDSNDSDSTDNNPVVVVPTQKEIEEADLAGVTLSDKTVEYDGNSHSLEIAGTLPTGVTVAYDTTSKVDVGEYDITATFTGSGNYTGTLTKTAKLTIEARPPFGLTYAWDTGDISSRTTFVAETFDKDHDGTPYILASVQHGVRAYTATGDIVWTYSGITYGHDTRDISVGDLLETGYNDTIVVCSGYDANPGSHHVGIVEKDGNELAEIRLANNAQCFRSLIVGTDIFIGGNNGVTKLVKSGNTWVEDTTNWNKAIGGVLDMYWGDSGNGPRLIVSSKGVTTDLFSFELDGTLEWSAITSANYDGRIEVGKLDNTINGKQIVKAYQGGAKVFDKDGNTLAALNTGLNVRTGLTLYDNDNDGEDEIYLADMGQDIYVWDRTGVNTYTVQYSALDISSTSTDYFGLQSYDIDEDGENEIIVGFVLGNVYIFNKDLSEKKLELNIGHGYIGSFDGGLCIRSGIKIADINGDGHPDMVIPGGQGYLDVYINNY